MKKLMLLILILCYNTSVFSQNKIQNINIWHFNALSSQHKGMIIDLLELLGKKAEKKYTLTINCAYSDEKVIIRSSKDTFYLSKEIENNYALREDEIIRNIEENASVHITYNEDIRNKIGTGSSTNKIDEIAKIIKKNKKGDFDIIWLNEFVISKNSIQYLENLYKSSLKTRDFSMFVPSLKQPYDRQQLRPNGLNYYEFIFSKVEYFNSYEVEIFLAKQGNLIYKNVISIGADNKLDKNGYIIMKGNFCNLYINEEILAIECYVQLNNIIDRKGIEKICIPCESKDLYQNYFTVRIRGVKDNFYKEEVWTEPVLFQFQCASGK